jgi:hypothetical protein
LELPSAALTQKEKIVSAAKNPTIKKIFPFSIGHRLLSFFVSSPCYSNDNSNA